MNYQYFPYLWLLGISFSILVFLAIISIKYREAKSSKLFGLCMINFAFWTFSNGLELAAVNLRTKLFWANMQYFSYTTIHVMWFLMVIVYIGKEKWITKKRVITLFIIPIIIIILVWTDKYHGLMRYGFSLIEIDKFSVINKNYGPLYWLHPIYGYSIVLTSIYLVLKAVFVNKSIYRMQAIALLVSPLISIIPSMLYVLSLSPIKAFDITPAFLGISGIIALIGLYKYKLFEIIPIARDTAVDSINVGMIVFDNRNIIIDFNKAANKQIGLDLTKNSLSSKEIMELLKINWEDLYENEYVRTEVTHNHTEVKYFEIELSSVINKQNKIVGKVILIRDITNNVHSQRKLIEQNGQLARSKEREVMARNLHDNLGQILAFINVQAQGVQKELSNEGVKTAKDKINKLVEVSSFANEDIRNYIRSTKFASNKEEDFLEILRETLDNFKNNSSIKVELEVLCNNISNILTSKEKTNMLYIINEALNNITKHSQTTNQVKIGIDVKEDLLEIIIKDDGSGFNLEEVDKYNSFGLDIMKGRASEINAEIDISSKLLIGTEIKLKLPIKDR